MALHPRILDWRIPPLRNMADYNPQGHQESDRSKCLTLSLVLFTLHK